MKYQKYVHSITAFNCILDIDLSVAFTFTSVSFLFFFTNLPLKPIYIVFSMAFYTRLCGSFGCFFTKCIISLINYKISIEQINVRIRFRNKIKHSFVIKNTFLFFKLFLKNVDRQSVPQCPEIDNDVAIRVENLSVQFTNKVFFILPLKSSLCFPFNRVDRCFRILNSK